MTFSQQRAQISGVYNFLINFKDGKKYNFSVGDGTIKLNGPMGSFKSEAEILSHVNGLIRSFIAGDQNIPERPFAGKYWR